MYLSHMSVVSSTIMTTFLPTKILKHLFVALLKQFRNKLLAFD